MIIDNPYRCKNCKETTFRIKEFYEDDKKIETKVICDNCGSKIPDSDLHMSSKKLTS